MEAEEAKPAALIDGTTRVAEQRRERSSRSSCSVVVVVEFVAVVVVAAAVVVRREGKRALRQNLGHDDWRAASEEFESKPRQTSRQKKEKNSLKWQKLVEQAVDGIFFPIFSPIRSLFK